MLRNVGTKVLRATPSSAAPSARRGMATTQQLKMRITSVSNIQKITKAMKMVAAAKLRHVEAQLGTVREFYKDVDQVWPEISEEELKAQDPAAGSPPADDAQAEVKDTLYVPVCSDRGLCGGINSGVLRIVRRVAGEAKADGKKVAMVTIGDKAKAGLERGFSKDFRVGTTEVGKQKAATFSEVSLVAEHILAQEFDEGSIFYNKFVSAISYEPQIAPLHSLSRAKKNQENWKNWELEGFQGEEETLDALHEFRLAVRLQYMFVENATSEMSARMSAMENSSKNAGEMIDKLQLMYNRQRQSKITTELIEIISGAAAAEEQQKKEASK